MSTQEFDPFTDRAFLAWARRICEELWLGLGAIEPSNDFLGFLWAAFSKSGEIPSAHLAPLVQKRRITLASHYMRLFLAQAEQDTGRHFEEAFLSSPSDEQEPTGLFQVGNSTIYGIHEVGIARETAEAVQDYLMARYWLVWPVCPTHDLGLHAADTGEKPVWECSEGGHQIPMISATQE
ncbi:hypothetical protein ABZV80_33395 [Streptomyces sp. NPDC005132]|uniref:hypothetical protein n=1 Tax=Streptomyces sp. NPDC005132 TaxID=3154294 RepID=UPI0033A567BD